LNSGVCKIEAMNRIVIISGCDRAKARSKRARKKHATKRASRSSSVLEEKWDKLPVLSPHSHFGEMSYFSDIKAILSS
jgi:hypothetical protein